MIWVERVKEYFKARLVKRLVITTLAFASSASMLISTARAAALNFMDDMPGRVVPMYGVPVTVGPPIVKYGPPPTVTATVLPAKPSLAMPAFDWNSMFPSLPFSGKPSMGFSAPDFGHMMPAFPKLFGLATSDVLSALALVAYATLLLAAVCGLALRGSEWYLKNKGEKK